MIYWLKSIFINHKKEEKRRYDQYYELFSKFLEQHNAKLLSLEYFYKLMGSMILTFEYNDTVHTCKCDRDNIYLDKEFICNGSYHIPGRDDSKDQMMKIIEERVFQNSEN